MARRYSGSKGKSGSKKPIKTSVPAWVTYKPKEIELLVAKLAKEGKSSSQIGLYLRDAYGVANVKTLTKKSITDIMHDKELLPEIPEDLISLMKNALTLRKHIEKNKHDETGRRGLVLTESKIRALVKYYKKKGRLSAEWKYNPQDVTMYLA